MFYNSGSYNRASIFKSALHFALIQFWNYSHDYLLNCTYSTWPGNNYYLECVWESCIQICKTVTDYLKLTHEDIFYFFRLWMLERVYSISKFWRRCVDRHTIIWTKSDLKSLCFFLQLAHSSLCFSFFFRLLARLAECNRSTMTMILRLVYSSRTAEICVLQCALFW